MNRHFINNTELKIDFENHSYAVIPTTIFDFEGTELSIEVKNYLQRSF